MRYGKLQLFEWAILAYTLFTLVLMAIMGGQLQRPGEMLMGRGGAVLLLLGLWQLYRWRPCRLTMLLRIVSPLCMLGWWYPDTYEFNRAFVNLDHIFASWEQALFGCQPALLLSQNYSSPVLSEVLSLGYFSYFPMIAAVTIYYFFCRYERVTYAAFVILGSFFLFYIIFIFLPVAGPQYYYQAVGLDQIAQGHFPPVGHYFLDHQESLPIPGAQGGLFHSLVQLTHAAGERPTAAFPSSHVGISVVLLWLACERDRSRSVSTMATGNGNVARGGRCWALIVPLMILSTLMFFATFYIQAHYAIDAIAGLFTGTAFYFLMRWFFRRIAFN